MEMDWLSGGRDMRRRREDRDQPRDDLSHKHATRCARRQLRLSQHWLAEPLASGKRKRGILADIRFTCDRDHG